MPMVVPVIWMMAVGVVLRVIGVTMIVIVVVVVMMVVMRVIMVVMVSVGRAALGLRIGAAFGIERRLERDHAGAETLGHRLDYGIAADAERLWQYFGRQMAVTEVPADADQRQCVSGPDLRQRLGLGDHFHHASVLEPQTVAAAQHCRFREVEQEFEPADAGHGDAPAITCVEVEHDRIRRGARPMAGRNHFVSSQHHCTFWKRGPIEPSLDEKRSKRQPACKPGSVWPGLIAPT
jgi:hypothetical protein